MLTRHPNEAESIGYSGGTLVDDEPDGSVLDRDREGGFCIWIRGDALV